MTFDIVTAVTIIMVMTTRAKTAKSEATKTYEARQKAIAAKLAQLQKSLAAHAKKQSASPTNYGFNGDLADAENYLDSAIRLVSQ